MRYFIILLLIFSAVQAQSKRAFTLADLYALKNVSDPQISPDGSYVLFTVTEYDMPAGTQNSDIWLYAQRGQQLRQLTHDAAADFHPRWSPSGAEILFVSYRSGSAQAWLLPLFAGEARQMTDFYTGVESPEWLPDGKGILFVSHVFPEAGADSDKNRALSEQLSNGPVQAHLADSLLFRHWTSYRDWQYKHLFHFDRHKESYTELTSGPVDAPAYSLGGRPFSISPDGKHVALSIKMGPDMALHTNNDIYLLELKSKNLRNLTASNKAYDNQPLFSPDGRYIAYIKQTVPGYEADRMRLTVYDREKDTHTVVSAEIDNWVNDFFWTPNSAMLYFTIHAEGGYPLYRVRSNGGEVAKVRDMSMTTGIQMAPDGSWLAVTRSSFTEPYELWKISIAVNKRQQAPEQITRFNDAIAAEVDLRPAEEHWIESPSGRKIHTFIIKPHGFEAGKKYPSVTNIHGGPQMQWSRSFRGDWQVYPGSGYVTVIPNPHGSTGYGQEFTAGISKDWGGKVYQDVLAVAEYISQLDYIDAENMGAMGWSWGGYMMMWLAGNEHPYKTLASMMGVYNLESMWGSTEELWFPEWEMGGTPYNSDLYRKWSPHTYMDNFVTPTLIITGKKDYRVPYTQSLEFFTALRRQGVDSRIIIFTNDGHWPSYVRSMPVYYNAHLEWFAKYLGGDEAPYNTEKMIRNKAFE
jgi:dipeptidyl aminopeptidase/acylaminoacyl peptidase